MSNIWNGPLGAPVPLVHAISILSGSDIPAAYKSSPLKRNGTSIELSRYPLFSFLTGSPIIRMSLANCITSLKYFSSVCACVIISAVLFFHIELAKCNDKYLSGLPVYFANIDGRSVDELVTITVFSGRSGESFS